MRTKTRGVKATHSKIPSKSSSITNYTINHKLRLGCSEAHSDTPNAHMSLNEDEYDNMGNSNSDDGPRPPLNSAPSSTVAEKHCELGSMGCVETEWTEKPTCLKCNRGGSLLVCSESDCPLAFHDQCLSYLASFDDLSGNFYCPYCFYKRVLAETAQLRKNAMVAKKALANFIDAKKPDGNHQKRKAERSEVDEPSSSKIRVDRNQADNENRRTSDNNNQFVQEEEHASAAGCIRSNLPDKVSETLSTVAQKNDGLMKKGGDNAKLTDCGQHTTMAEHEMQPNTSVGNCNDNHREEETAPSKESSETLISVGKTNEVKNRHQVTIAEVVGEISKEQHLEQVDVHRHVEVVENQQQAEPSIAVCSSEEMSRLPNFSKKRKQNNEYIFKEDEGRTGKEGPMQTHSQETTVSSTGADPTLDVHEQAADSIQETQILAADQRHAEKNVGDRNEKVTITSNSRQLQNPLKQGSETTDSIREDTRIPATEQRPVSRRTQNKMLPQDVGPSRRSSSLLNTTTEDNAGDRNEEVTTSSKTRQPSKKLRVTDSKSANPKSLNARRRKLMWTVEEEEILKEGLQRFSSKNKISWKTILDFGRHIFDESRTPDDLRDKWRNNLAKQCSYIRFKREEG